MVFYSGSNNHISSSSKLSILSQILPRIKDLSGKNIVIKYGGNAMIDIKLQRSFARDVVLLSSIGLNLTIVHGGAPQIERALKSVGKKGEFIDGIRVTDLETMKIVEWVLVGQVQQSIVSMINEIGGKAIGLTGKDGNFIHSKKKYFTSRNQYKKPIDLGFVGEIVSINLEPIETLQSKNFIPIISPIGYGAGVTYNINADSVASNLAKSLKAKQLLLMTNTAGILNNDGSLFSELSAKNANKLLENGTISGGMIPKIQSSLDAAKNGVESVYIIDGRVEHNLLSAIFFNMHEFGTKITC